MLKKFLYFFFASLVFGLALFSCKLIVKHRERAKLYHCIEIKAGAISDATPFGVSYFIKDLESGKIIAVRDANEKFPAASLLKLPILAAVFKAIDEDKLSLSQIITIRRQDITGGSGVLKRMKCPIKISLRQLLNFMLARSDNTATNKVISILGYEYINNSFQYFKLKDTVLARDMMDFSQRANGVENYTTPLDISRILELMYKGKLVSDKLSSLGLEILKKQKVNDRIPRYLPKVPIAHKTGLERGVVHDAGIVFSPNGDYLICVFTYKTKKYSTAKRLIADVSKAVYDTYQKL